VQKQQINGYQKASDLYCVTAIYNKTDSGLIQVENRANKGGINKGLSGEHGTKSKSWFSLSMFTSLCANQVKAGTGELAVQPCFLFNLGPFSPSGGPYWVLAIDDVNYEWAVVSGGQPTKVITEEGGIQCTTKETGTNGSGLWLFTRSPIPAKGVVNVMEQKLRDMGVATDHLLPVQQAGCTYRDMPIKPSATAIIVGAEAYSHLP